MTGHRDPRTRRRDEKPAARLGDRLRLMFDWYKGMVDESTERLLYLYDPENDITIGTASPFVTSPRFGMSKCRARFSGETTFAS
jgi:hypothetical protein